MRFRTIYRNQFRVLQFSLFLLLFTTACVLYYYYSDPLFPLLIFAWILLILLVPVLFLHFEYLYYNRSSEFIINNDLSTLTYKNGHQEISLNFSQIARIVFYLPPSAYRGEIEREMQFLPTEAYGYAEIHFKGGEKLIITSLMMPDIRREFEKIGGVPIERKKRLLASPSVEKLLHWFTTDGL